MKNYYVYAYLDTSKPINIKYKNYNFEYEPFYIGKGKRDRLNDHLKESLDFTSNKHKVNKINKLLNNNSLKIVKVLENLSDEDAFAHEIKLINLFGRRNNNTGVLTNLTDGGEGSLGLIWNQESIDKISGSNNHFYGKDHSPEAKEKIGKASTKFRKGKTWEDLYGKEKADIIREKRSNYMKENNPGSLNKGKKNEEIHGVVKAKAISDKQSRSHTGKILSEQHKKNISGSVSGKNNPAWKDIDITFIINLFVHENKSVDYISSKLNVSNSTICRRIKQEIGDNKFKEISKRNKKIKLPEDHYNYKIIDANVVFDKLLKGINKTEICKEYDCSLNTLNRRLKVDLSPTKYKKMVMFEKYKKYYGKIEIDEIGIIKRLEKGESLKTICNELNYALRPLQRRIAAYKKMLNCF